MSEALTSEASPSQSFPEEVHANTESGTGRRSRIRPRKDASRSSDRRLFEAEFPSGDDPERILIRRSTEWACRERIGKIRCGTAHGKVEPAMQGITAAKGRTENTEEQGQNKNSF